MDFLPFEFYARDTGDVARDLLGKVLVRKLGRQVIMCRIIETEAYYEQGDPASHAARGRTKRNAVMFGHPGRAYVYFNYGTHYLLNVVSEAPGRAGAVLIRALEPIDGTAAMMRNRPVSEIVQLTSGPGKLTQALGIDISYNGRRLSSPKLGIIEQNGGPVKIVSRERIGISQGRHLPYRFYIENNRFVSRR